MIQKIYDRVKEVFYIKPQQHFIIIGVPKSGSSSLYEYLRKHPEIHLSIAKEHNFFMSIRHDWLRKNKIRIFFHVLGFSFLKFFPFKYVIRKRYFNTCHSRPGKVSGDGSVNYFYFDKGKVATRIKSYVPEAKLILLLRNPVDRLQSNFWMNKKQAKSQDGWEMEYETFDEYVQKERYKESINQYAENLKIWFKFFEKKQILILKTSCLARKREETLNRVYSFIGVSEFKINGNYLGQLAK